MPGFAQFIKRLRQKDHNFSNGQSQEGKRTFLINRELYAPEIGHYSIIKNNDGSTTPFTHYIVFFDQREGSGSYGDVYKALPLDPNSGKIIFPGKYKLKRSGDGDSKETGRIIIIKPLVAKLTNRLSPAMVKNEASILKKRGFFTEDPMLITYNNHFKGYHCIITEYLEGANLKEQNLNNLGLLEIINMICQYAAELHRSHHYTQGSNPIILGDIKLDNATCGGGRASLIDHTASCELKTSLEDPAQHHKVEMVGTASYLPRERLVDGFATLNSDTYALTPIILKLLRVPEQEIFKNKNKISPILMHEGGLSIATRETRRQLAEAKYGFNGIFAGIQFPKNLVCGEAGLKMLIKHFIEHLQDNDSKKRANSRELLQFFLSLHNLLILVQAIPAQEGKSHDPTQQYIYLAKMIIASKGLWKTGDKPDDVNFDFFDFENNKDFCKMITTLYSKDFPNKELLKSLVIKKQTQWHDAADSEHKMHPPVKDSLQHPQEQAVPIKSQANPTNPSNEYEPVQQQKCHLMHLLSHFSIMPLCHELLTDNFLKNPPDSKIMTFLIKYLSKNPANITGTQLILKLRQDIITQYKTLENQLGKENYRKIFTITTHALINKLIVYQSNKQRIVNLKGQNHHCQTFLGITLGYSVGVKNDTAKELISAMLSNNQKKYIKILGQNIAQTGELGEITKEWQAFYKKEAALQRCHRASSQRK